VSKRQVFYFFSIFTFFLVLGITEVDGTKDQEDVHLAQRTVRLLLLVRDEYFLSVQGSPDSREEEYQESLEFFQQAREIALQLSFYASLSEGFQTLQKALEDRSSIPQVEHAVDSLRQLLEKQVGPLEWRLPSGVSVSLGTRVYAENCRECHGPPPREIGGFHPPNLFSLSFLQDKSPMQLFTLVSEGIPGTPMPSFRESLSESERWSVILSLFLMGEEEKKMVKKGRWAGHFLPPDYKSYPPETLLTKSIENLTQNLTEGKVPETQRLVLAQWIILQPFLLPSSSSVQDILSSSREKWINILRETQQKVEQGDFRGASSLLHDLYMELEQKEVLLKTTDPSATQKLESLFHQLLSEVKTPDSFHPTAEKWVSALEQFAVQTQEKLSPRWVIFQSFLIIFREGLEAFLILVAILAYLKRIHQEKFYRQVFVGAGSGLALTGLTALLAQTVYTILKNYQEGLEGFTLLLAAAVLFTVSFWLISHSLAENWQKYIQHQVHQALGRGSRWALISVAFLAIYREGLETILFYQSLFYYSRNFSSLLLGFSLGFLFLFFVGILFYRFMLKLPLRLFFSLTSLFLYGLSFSFIGKGIQELQNMGWVGVTFLKGFPTLGLLGLYPTLETLAAQGALLTVSGFLMLRFYLKMVRSPSPT